MSTAIGMTAEQAMEDFRKRVLEKLKSDIGALFPDEALVKLVEEAVKKQFFEERKTFDEYGRLKTCKQSWFVEEVAKQAAPIIQAYVKDWLLTNEPLIREGCSKFLESQNLLLITFAALRDATRQDIFDVATQITTRIKQGY